MDEKNLEIWEFVGEGYLPLVDYGKWRVAMLRYLDELHPERIETMERHFETDEVFVLLHGKCTLLLGGNEAQVKGITPQPMEPGKIYNVKRNAWHSVLLSRDASILLVENQDTCRENSEYFTLTEELRSSLLKIARGDSFLRNE